MYELRDYQKDFVARVRDAFRSHRRVLGVSPTGSGKTVAFAYITTSAAEKGNRVIVVAHRKEIVDQISHALDEMGVRHGRIQPGHAMTDDPVQVAMIQTLARRAGQVTPPDFLVIDEAHHCASESYAAVCALWPNARILGVTATPQRLDGRGLGRMFSVMVEGPVTGDLIQRAWLARYIYLAPPTKVDLSRVSTRHGDYAVDEMAAEVDKAVITGDAIEHYRAHLEGRSAIAFTVRVDHAEHVAEQFLAAGIPAASVDGTMDRATRRDRMEGLASGRYKVLTSCALISEGLDVPSVGGVILLRPTKSLAMHLQQIGRALRPKPDRAPAIILDHVGNIHRHGLPDATRKWALDDKKKKQPLDPTSQCEVCYRIFDAGPGWKKAMLEAVDAGDEENCEQPEHPECLIRGTAASGGVEAPEQVNGQLIIVTDTPVWGGGASILLAKGAEWKALLDLADTREKLEEIRRARGYHAKWITHVLDARRRG